MKFGNVDEGIPTGGRREGVVFALGFRRKVKYPFSRHNSLSYATDLPPPPPPASRVCALGGRWNVYDPRTGTHAVVTCPAALSGATVTPAERRGCTRFGRREAGEKTASRRSRSTEHNENGRIKRRQRNLNPSRTKTLQQYRALQSKENANVADVLTQPSVYR